MHGSKGGPREGHGRRQLAALLYGLATVVAPGAALSLAGCAAGPAPAVDERTDERTAVTVATLPKPLLFTGARAANGANLDLALGPVEVNRQGQRTWYVWAALLGEDLSRGEPRLRLVSGTQVLLELAAAPATLSLPLSREPYAKPADWATVRYFEVSADDLARLRGSGAFGAELAAADGETWRFEPWDAAFDRLDAFLAEQLQGRVATR